MYSYTKESGKSFADAEAAVREALKARGFGVITEIDAQRTVKEKLGQDMLPYKILGACNPQFAHKAMTAEPGIGVLLPCNVLIREDAGKTVISCILPTVQLGKADNPSLLSMAEDVERLLKQTVDEAS